MSTPKSCGSINPSCGSIGLSGGSTCPNCGSTDLNEIVVCSDAVLSTRFISLYFPSTTQDVNRDVLMRAVDTLRDNRQVLIRQLAKGRFGQHVVSSTSETVSNPVSPDIPLITIGHHTHTLCNVVCDITRLRSLDHENVVTVHEVLVSATSGHIYVVNESFTCDLKDLIQDGGPLGDDYVKLFTYQMLRGLKYMHSAGITHGALDPHQVLIDPSHLTLKLTGYVRGDDSLMTSGSYYYSAPELLLAVDNVTTAVDLWSVGCMVVEMITGKLLFKEASAVDQLVKLTHCIHLTNEDWTSVLKVLPNKLLKNHPFRPRTPIYTLLGQLDFQATASLSQSYLSEYHCLTDEPSMDLPTDQRQLVDRPRPLYEPRMFDRSDSSRYECQQSTSVGLTSESHDRKRDAWQPKSKASANENNGRDRERRSRSAVSATRSYTEDSDLDGPRIWSTDDCLTMPVHTVEYIPVAQTVKVFQNSEFRIADVSLELPLLRSPNLSSNASTNVLPVMRNESTMHRKPPASPEVQVTIEDRNQQEIPSTFFTSVQREMTINPSPIECFDSGDEHEVAIKNLRNYRERLTGGNTDRTPSPVIIDLINQRMDEMSIDSRNIMTRMYDQNNTGSVNVGSNNDSTDDKERLGVKEREGSRKKNRGSVGGKKQLLRDDIEGDGKDENEKDIADISEAKRLEDMELENVSVVDDTTLIGQSVVSIESFLDQSRHSLRSSLASVSPLTTTLIARRQRAKLNTSDLLRDALADGANRISTNEGSADDSKKIYDDEKPSLTSCRVSVPAEDSNKLNRGKSNVKLNRQSIVGGVSRKLILDKMESEKSRRRGGRVMEGDVTRGGVDITSEEFDDLYRLPTDHLRKDNPPPRASRYRTSASSHDYRNQSQQSDYFRSQSNQSHDFYRSQSYDPRSHSYDVRSSSHDTRVHLDLATPYDIHHHHRNQSHEMRMSHEFRNQSIDYRLSSSHDCRTQSYECSAPRWHDRRHDTRMYYDSSSHDTMSSFVRMGCRNGERSGASRSTDCGSLPDERRAADDINSKYKEDWFNPEGACGGIIYPPQEEPRLYRTGSIELRSSIELDLEPYIEPLQLDDVLIATPPRPVVVPLGVGLGAGREASSSPESPVSPRSSQVGGAVARGARPKKSSKKHRAV